MSDDILIKSLRPEERGPYAIVSVASPPKRRGKATRFGQVGQNRDVASGRHKLVKPLLQRREEARNMKKTPRACRTEKCQQCDSKRKRRHLGVFRRGVEPPLFGKH